MKYDYQQLHNDMTTIKNVWKQWFNGWHIEPKEWEEFEQAVSRVNKLKKIVPKEVGVM